MSGVLILVVLLSMAVAGPFEAGVMVFLLRNGRDKPLREFFDLRKILVHAVQVGWGIGFFCCHFRA